MRYHHAPFVKRKKFTKEHTKGDRLREQWDQEVFMILQKYPHAEERIDSLRKTHSGRGGTGAFIPSEESLAALAELRLALT